jgi:cyclopropane-fatty-acyl-phospholipid synthase
LHQGPEVSRRRPRARGRRGAARRRHAAPRLVSGRTLRIWRAYLAGCSYGFQQGWVTIHQLLGSVQRGAGPSALPLTRDWIYRG